jgi:neutral ceramidase
MTLLAGAAEAEITPSFPVDLLGYVRRPLAARSAYEPLMATACVFRDSATGTTVVIIAADVVGLTTPMADRIRARVGELVGCDPSAVLLNSSHSHAAPWPGATVKLGGEFDDWTATELAYWDSIPDRYASVALEAVGRLEPASVSGGVGRVEGLAVNRRERTTDGRTILGWNRDGVRDDSVVAIRVDGLDGAPAFSDGIATLVSFACHPVVIGPDYPGAGPDFVGPLRSHLSHLLRPVSVTVFLQGAAGDALPLESFRDDGAALAAADVFGTRIALEAAHAVADANPWAVEVDRSDWGSVTPISLYRRRLADDQPPQALRSTRRIVSLPFLELPPAKDLERELAERRADLVARAERGESRVTMNPIRYHISWLEMMLAQDAAGGRATAIDGEIWAARIGDCAIVGAPGEIFGAIGTAVRRASPAPVTIFAGYSQGSLGYVATPDEYPHGGYEPAISHRGYGQPAPFSPEVAGIIERTAIELLSELFVQPSSGA